MSLEASTYTGRWLRFQRYAPDQIRRLLTAERAAQDRWDKYRDKYQPKDPMDREQRLEAYRLNTQARGEGWQIVGTRIQAVFDRDLDDYWDKKKTDVAREVERFEAYIYPIWGPLLRHDNKDFRDELAALHAADLAILRSGYRVNRGSTTAPNNTQAEIEHLYGDLEALPYRERP